MSCLCLGVLEVRPVELVEVSHNVTVTVGLASRATSGRAFAVSGNVTSDAAVTGRVEVLVRRRVVAGAGRVGAALRLVLVRAPAPSAAGRARA